MDEILTVTVGASKKWIDLGLALGLSNDDLSNIDKHLSPRECLREMYALCIQLDLSTFTLSGLCSALESACVCRNDISRKIKEKI